MNKTKIVILILLFWWTTKHNKGVLDLYPDAFEEVVHAYNQFRSNILVLQDFKAALHGVECEIDQIAHRLQEEKNIVFFQKIR